MSFQGSHASPNQTKPFSDVSKDKLVAFDLSSLPLTPPPQYFGGSDQLCIGLATWVAPVSVDSMTGFALMVLTARVV